jgi:hypothetical protein
VLAESQSPEAFAQTLREATLAQEADFWEIPKLGESTMPKVYGTDDQKGAAHRPNQSVATFIRPCAERRQPDERTRPMSPGAKPSYQPLQRVSPPIQQIIAEDTATRIAHGWMEAAPNEFTRYGSPIVVALQKGKHSVCTD